MAKTKEVTKGAERWDRSIPGRMKDTSRPEGDPRTWLDASDDEAYIGLMTQELLDLGLMKGEIHTKLFADELPIGYLVGAIYGKVGKAWLVRAWSYYEMYNVSLGGYELRRLAEKYGTDVIRLGGMAGGSDLSGYFSGGIDGFSFHVDCFEAVREIVAATREAQQGKGKKKKR